MSLWSITAPVPGIHGPCGSFLAHPHMGRVSCELLASHDGMHKDGPTVWNDAAQAGNAAPTRVTER